MEAVKEETPAETEQVTAEPAAPVLGPNETPPIPAPRKRPIDAGPRDASGGLGAIPFFDEAHQAEASQVIHSLNALVGAVNARLGLVQSSAVKPEEKKAESAEASEAETSGGEHGRTSD